MGRRRHGHGVGGRHAHREATPRGGHHGWWCRGGGYHAATRAHRSHVVPAADAAAATPAAVSDAGDAGDAEKARGDRGAPPRRWHPVVRPQARVDGHHATRRRGGRPRKTRVVAVMTRVGEVAHWWRHPRRWAMAVWWCGQRHWPAYATIAK